MHCHAHPTIQEKLWEGYNARVDTPLNPISPKNDQHQFSPNNINTLS